MVLGKVYAFYVVPCLSVFMDGLWIYTFNVPYNLPSLVVRSVYLVVHVSRIPLSHGRLKSLTFPVTLTPLSDPDSRPQPPLD